MSDIRIKMAKDLRDMSDMVGDLHWMAAKAVEDLIKKDARIVELEAWKAQGMQVMSPLMDYARGVCTGPLGCSLADWLVQDHKQLRAELAAIKAQDLVAWPDDKLIELAFTNFGGKWNGDLWTIEDANLHPFVRSFAAPVPVENAQVVMPERWNVPRPMWKDARQPFGNPLNHADIEAAEKFNLALDEVARLNAIEYAAPVSEAKAQSAAKMPCGTAVSNVYEAYDAGMKAAKAQGVAVPSELARAFITGESCNGVYRVVIQSETLKEMHAVHRWITGFNAAPVRQVSCKVCGDFGSECDACGNAAPAAPAADAGLVELECSDCNGSEWQTLPDEEGVLRDMKCHCALAAHRSKGVV